MPPRSILVITGASGSGKTAIVTALAAKPHPGIGYHHFDSVGVPSTEQMIAQFGSPEAWQASLTHQWIQRLASAPTDSVIDVLEGQVRLGIVQDAFLASAVRKGSMLLLDCSPEIRAVRLRGPRGQPELASDRMTAWAAYLRGQADALHVPVLDTTDLSLEGATEQVRQYIAATLAAD